MLKVSTLQKDGLWDYGFNSFLTEEEYLRENFPNSRELKKGRKVWAKGQIYTYGEMTIALKISTFLN